MRGCAAEVMISTFTWHAQAQHKGSLFVPAESYQLFQPCLSSLHQIHPALSTRGFSATDLCTSEAKKASNQTSCILCSGLCGIDMKATPVFLHAGCFHSPPSREPRTAQHGESLLVASRFLIIIPHLGSWIQPRMHMSREARRERERERERERTRGKEREGEMGRGRWNFHEAQGWCGQPQWKCKDWTFLQDWGRVDASRDSRGARGWGEGEAGEGLGESGSGNSLWMWGGMKRTGFIAGILISALLFFSHPLVLFTPL